MQIGAALSIPSITTTTLGNVQLEVGGNVEGAGPTPMRWGNVEVSAFGVSTGAAGAAARGRTEGALAWSLGLQATLLPATHPYSWRRP